MFKGRHFDRSVILLCVRWYLAYGLSLRDLEEMMAERGILVDHTTIHRWTVHYAPLLLEQLNRPKRRVTGKWHVDETYIEVRGQWRHLYRALDSNGETVEFWFSKWRNLATAKRFLCKALKRHGRPERIMIDGSQTNREAILSCDTTDRLQDRSRRKLKPIRIRQSAYLNNRIEQDHRAVKRRVRPMLALKLMASARAILGGIEMVHMMRKRQAKYARSSQLSLADQFERLAACAPNEEHCHFFGSCWICDRSRQSAYLNNRIEQDHRAIKRRVRPMLGFQSVASARAILGGSEMIRMMHKQQAKYACKRRPSLAEQFELLAA
jgi:putative transposase